MKALTKREMAIIRKAYWVRQQNPSKRCVWKKLGKIDRNGIYHWVEQYARNMR